MTSLIKVLILVAVSGLIAAPALAQLAAQPQAAAAPAGSEAIASAIKAMQQAKDPSAVVDAFATAQEAGKNNVALHEAYIRRMAEFGMAELVRAQAQRLVELDPQNALGWGMQAYLHAVKGEMDKAVARIIKATEKPTDDPFVLNVAGQLLAWFDQKPLRNEFDEPTRKALEQMRKTLAEKDAFAEGYTQASEAYQGLKEKPAQPGVAAAAGGGSTVFAEPTAETPGTQSVEIQPATPRVVEAAPEIIYQPYPVYEPPTAIICEPLFYDRVILFTPFFFHHHHRLHNGFFAGQGRFGRNNVVASNSVTLPNGTRVTPLDIRNTGLNLQAATGQPNMLNTGLPNMLNTGLPNMLNTGQPDMRNRLNISGRGIAGNSSGRVLSTTPRTSLGVPRIDNSGRGNGGDRVLTTPRADTPAPRIFNPSTGGRVLTTPSTGVPRITNSGPGSGPRIFGPAPSSPPIVRPAPTPLPVPRFDNGGSRSVRDGGHFSAPPSSFRSSPAPSYGGGSGGSFRSTPSFNGGGQSGGTSGWQGGGSSGGHSGGRR